MKDTPLLDLVLPPPVQGRCDVLFIAGEHSGDEHAARVAQAAMRENPQLACCALGGTELEAAGVQLLHDLTASSVVGLVEVLKNYGYFKQLFEKILNWIAEHRPKAVCFVDYPGFNLRVAQELVARGVASKGGGDVKLLYYIGPQVWAWKKKRRFKMAQYLDALAVIFPFEVGVFKDTTLPTTFVGHPFAQADYSLPLRYDAKAPVLLLPGSRVQAVRRIFPVLIEGWAAFLKTHPHARATVIYPSAKIRNVIESLLGNTSAGFRASLSLVQAHATSVAACAVLSSSGTMSLNVALAGIPGAVCYRAHPMTYYIGRMLVSIEYLGIANLLLNRPAWPEYIQGAASPRALCAELQECTQKPARRTRADADAQALFAMLAENATLAPQQWLLEHLG